MPHTTRPLYAARWAAIKALRPSSEMIHQSADAYMLPNPLGAHLPWLPFVQRPGVTYSAGRNKAKRGNWPQLSGKSRRRLRIAAERLRRSV